MLDGMELGDNTKAALMTRGILEISRLGVELGGKMETFFGLSGIGDLIVTCTSKHSRNHNCGYLLGKGKTLDIVPSFPVINHARTHTTNAVICTNAAESQILLCFVTSALNTPWILINAPDHHSQQYRRPATLSCVHFLQ